MLDAKAFRWLPWVLAAASGAAQAQLNDSGQVRCYNATAITGTVSVATPAPADAGFEEQDCTRGRDTAAALGQLTKLGAGAAGFDFSKIANDGSDLPAGAALGTDPADWGCTRDNVTGLMWEVKTNDNGLRDKDHSYVWYDANTTINGGDSGPVGGNSCNGTLPAGQCNTSAYVAAVNALAGSNRLCGHTDWRMPTGQELQSIAHYGATAAPYIDVAYFPNTTSPFAFYWSGVTVASFAQNAWYLSYDDGGLLSTNGKQIAGQVRLVRGAP
jgi:hypothetical protein